MNRHSRLVQRHDDVDPHRASSPPLYLSATYRLNDPDGSDGGYDYARSGNPTRSELETRLAALEGAPRAAALASGLAALRTLIAAGSARPRVIVSADLYGGSLRLLGTAAERGELELIAGRDEEEIEVALGQGADLLLVESPGNPGLGVLDLRRLTRAAREAGVPSCVDASLMSPWLMRPLDLGADVVLHSATKFLGGHGDLTAGVLATRDAELAEALAFARNAEGNALAPFDAWLLMRGLDTLGVRVERQQTSATLIAARLASRTDEGLRVLHPSLPDHPGAALHARQARGPGSVISLVFARPGRAREVLARLRRFGLTVSFGSVRSTASLPQTMSHASVPEDLREGSRAADELVRLSIGLEDAEDLLRDLEAALGATASPKVAREEPAATAVAFSRVRSAGGSRP